MRKPTWWDLGIAVLGLVLVCSAVQGAAQSPYPEGSVGDVTQDSRITGTSDGMGSDQGLTTGGTATGQGTATGTGTQQSSDVEAQQRLEIARLRAQVAGLEQQLAQMRVQVARAQQAQGTGGSGQGTGGSGEGTGASGTAGVGDTNAEAPQGSTGAGSSTAEGVGGGSTVGRAADTSNEGYAVATIIHRGRVRSVSPQQLVLDEEDGGTSTLPLARDVRVTRGREQVALKNLSEGTLVRTNADLYARGNPVTSIEVLSPPKTKTPSR
ncbi:hypothetical protein NR798_45910 [Archangium gephyra]|uniref:hypothetical protein n=1 Tax=Archangium gephyra TaxID=48 RepID=UPI0035D4CCAF